LPSGGGVAATTEFSVVGMLVVDHVKSNGSPESAEVATICISFARRIDLDSILLLSGPMHSAVKTKHAS